MISNHIHLKYCLFSLRENINTSNSTCKHSLDCSESLVVFLFSFHFLNDLQSDNSTGIKSCLMLPTEVDINEMPFWLTEVLKAN